jgi:membrane-bound serine protease (ClpP class)
MKAAAVVLAAVGMLLGAGSPAVAAAANRPLVYEIAIEGGIDAAVARAVDRAIGDATDAHAAAVLVRLDTPGGLLSSMHSIVKSIQASPVPVVCWVGPPGSRAASAGTFILIGCPVAAMAPSTNVGAAHPITSTGETAGEKVTNDAVAEIRSLAETYGRNADWAEQAVRKSSSISAQHAVDIHVADLIAPSVSVLLTTINGRQVDTAVGARTLRVADAQIHEVGLTAGEQFLHWLSDADLGFLLFVFGIAGLIFEVLHPGLNVPGLLGLISLVLSLVVFDTLPVNVAGALMLVGAFVCFVVDIKAAGHGLPTLAGITLFVLGGLFLYTGSTERVTRPLLIAIAVALGLFFLGAAAAALTARKAPVVSGVERMLGARGVVTQGLDPLGYVRVQGHIWRATLAEGTLPRLPVDAAVRVLEVRGLTLVVEPAVEVEAEPELGSIKREMTT